MTTSFLRFLLLAFLPSQPYNGLASVAALRKQKGGDCVQLYRKASAFLAHLAKYQDYRRYDQLERDFKGFDERIFWEFYESGMLDVYPNVPEEHKDDRLYLIDNHQFRIGYRGLAARSSDMQKIWEEVRAWVALVISALALGLSIASIVLQSR